MPSLRILNAEAVAAALPMEPLVAAMKTAYAALSAGEAVVPLRTHLPIDEGEAAALIMPAFVPGSSGRAPALAVKVVTLFPGNPAQGLPFIHAGVLVMDPGTGEILALLEGGTLTARRTGAGAGAATDLLARREACTVAILGAGRQARTQLEAVCAVRAIEEVRVYSPTPGKVRDFITHMAAQSPAEYRAAASPAEAVAYADIICTATTSAVPVFADEDVAPGTHINAVGSYTPEMIEVPPETIARARVAVDSRSACAAEAGELIRAIDLGLIDPGAVAEIGEVVLGTKPGRTSPEEITFFKSVGVAVQDAAAAALALERAHEQGSGIELEW